MGERMERKKKKRETKKPSPRANYFFINEFTVTRKVETPI
jgi:hypothetical protein